MSAAAWQGRGPARAPALARPVALLPGLVVVLALTAVAFAVNRVRADVSALVAAVALGALVANAVDLPPATVPGTRFASRRLLRLGVVLLGFRLAVGDLIDIGLTGVVIVALVVTAGT